MSNIEIEFFYWQLPMILIPCLFISVCAVIFKKEYFSHKKERARINDILNRRR